MDPRRESASASDAPDAVAGSDARADATGESTQGERSQSELARGEPADGGPGQSSGADVLTLGLFGVMVIIASVCFVIW